MNGLTQGLIGLAPLWPYVLLGVLLLLVLLLVGLVLFIRAARQGTPAPQTAPGAAAAVSQATDCDPAHPAAMSMRRSFLQGLRLLEAHVAGRARRYRMPWFLLLG